MLVDLLPLLAEQRSPRTMAFAMLGLARARRAAVGQDVLRDLAERLAAQQRDNASDDWLWPEDVLAYDNARLPQCLIAAAAPCPTTASSTRVSLARLVRGAARGRRLPPRARRPFRASPRRTLRERRR
jgi:hypothetical protein